ncbi:MAG TPA: ABC transporter ATP-binding protein [Candidatus Saccharimonadales bacterium]|nr:ABC transporter ATP-binding protein [Candidatus Saccharimonadales bacterium]
MDETFIRLEDLHKSFGPKRVLAGVTLDIRRGETVVVIGGSGTGKSVLLRHIIGLHRPDSGRVLVDGVDVTSLAERDLMPVRRKVSMVFQAGALFDSMSVYENIAFGLRELGELDEDAIAVRVREKLALVELEGVEDLMPQDLSGGMRKRVALARAIAMEPAGLLYDEPTTGLDPITAMNINRLIRSIQRALGVTSIVVTHDISSAFHVGDRLAYLYDGGLVFTGTMEEAKASGDPLLHAFLTGESPKGDGR